MERLRLTMMACKELGAKKEVAKYATSGDVRRQEFRGRICIDCVFMKSVASAPGKVILFGEHFVVTA